MASGPVANAVLRCVNGSWFCPRCFIPCSTKGNLKRHMKKIHIDSSWGETAEENSFKFIFLEGNNLDEDGPDEEDSFDKDFTTASTEEDPDQFASSQEHDFDAEDEFVSLQAPINYATEIDTLYAKLSQDFHTKTVDLQSPRQRNIDDSSSETESSGSVSDDSIVWSSDNESPYSDSDDENKEHGPIFEGSNVTYEEHLMAIMSLAARHNLNQAQLSDLIEVIKLHCPDGGVCVSSGKALYKEVTGDVEVEYHDVCEDCFALFPEDSNVYRCLTTGCAGLRYRGKICDQDKKRRKSYFISVPFEEQFKDILERQHIWSSIQQRYLQRGKSSNLRDIIDGEEYKKHCKPGGILHNQNNISVLLNSDGIPIFKSSGIGIWPVQLVVNEIHPDERFLKKNMILWGIWQGKGKPAMHAFHRPLVMAMNKLSSEGLMICPPDCEPINTHVFPLLTTMDLQGKGFWLNMVLHNGAFGCLDCYTKGYHVPSGKGYAHCYPYSEFKKAALRTSQQFKDDAAKAQQSNKTVNGIKGFSLILALQHHDVIPGYVIDYMHGALLGVTKRLLTLWFSPSKDNKGKDFFIGEELQTVDKRLQSMKPPDFIVRLPRSLQSNLHHLKASELKVWLLYYSLPTLNGVLPKKYLQHFALFVESIFILLGDNISREDLELAEHLMDGFYRKFADLYGESKCGLNVHNLIHYVNQVRAWGPLWCYSCFPFEDLNGDYVDSVHGTRHICLQIVRMFFSEKKLEIKSLLMKNDTQVQKFIQRMLSSARRPKNVTEAAKCWLVGKPVRFVPQEEVKTLLCNTGGDEIKQHTLQKLLRVMINHKVYYSEQYKRMSKRISHAVMFQSHAGTEFGLIKYFVHDKDTGETYALMHISEVTDSPPALRKFSHHHFWLSEERKSFMVVNVAAIEEKVFYLSGNKDNVCVARAPNFVERE